MQRIDHVIFDCDGVLIDSEIISARMLIAELARYGVAIDLPYIAENFFGRSYPVVLEAIRKDFAVDLPASFEPEYRARLLAVFERELKIMPGVRGMIDRLRVPFGLATSSSRPRMERSLAIVGLTEAFAGQTTTAGEVTHGKPAPDLFLRAAEKLDADPARTLVIEDSLNGIRAAQAAGMVVVRFVGGTHLRHLDPGNALTDPLVPEFASFSDLAQLVPDVLIEKGRP